eukprot:2861610-Rhodomonas_salina.1
MQQGQALKMPHVVWKSLETVHSCRQDGDVGQPADGPRKFLQLVLIQSQESHAFAQGRVGEFVWDLAQSPRLEVDSRVRAIREELAHEFHHSADALVPDFDRRRQHLVPVEPDLHQPRHRTELKREALNLVVVDVQPRQVRKQRDDVQRDDVHVHLRQVQHCRPPGPVCPPQEVEHLACAGARNRGRRERDV